MLSFFPRGVLDDILNLIESVSEGFPSYSLLYDRRVYLIYVGVGENKYPSWVMVWIEKSVTRVTNRHHAVYRDFSIHIIYP